MKFSAKKKKNYTIEKKLFFKHENIKSQSCERSCFDIYRDIVLWLPQIISSNNVN